MFRNFREAEVRILILEAAWGGESFLMFVALFTFFIELLMKKLLNNPEIRESRETSSFSK